MKLNYLVMHKGKELEDALTFAGILSTMNNPNTYVVVKGGNPSYEKDEHNKFDIKIEDNKVYAFGEVSTNLMNQLKDYSIELKAEKKNA